YALQGGLVDALLKAGKNEAALQYPLWNQDFHGSRGILGRVAMRFMLAKDLPAPAVEGGPTALDDDRDRWVTVDRLLQRKDDGTPQLVLLVRSSGSRPRFPKPVSERERELVFDGALAPVPVPVRRPPRR